MKLISPPARFFFFFNLFIYLFIYFWLCWVFVAAHRLSLVEASGSYSSLWRAGFSLRWLLLLRSTGSRRTGFSSWGRRASIVVACELQQLWLAGSRAQAQQLSHTDLVAPRHVGSSWTRARTCVPCLGRQILNLCASRGAQVVVSLGEFGGFSPARVPRVIPTIKRRGTLLTGSCSGYVLSFLVYQSLTILREPAS